MDRLWQRVDKRALLVTALCIIGWRVLLQLPVLDITRGFILYRLQGLAGPVGLIPAIGYRSLPFQSVSVGSLGIAPYVSAMIVMSLVAGISSSVANIPGLLRWTRALGLLFAMAQSYGWTVIEQSGGGALDGLDWSARLAICLQLAAGTATMIWLADLIDEYGLGFGYGALILYALGPVANEVHRLSDYVSSVQPVQLLYRPLAVWAVFTIGVAVISVIALLAVRGVALPAPKGTKRIPTLELGVVPSGVMRPPAFAFAVMFLPTLIANYYVTDHPTAREFVNGWYPFGPNLLLSAAYLLIEAGLIVAFAVFVVALDCRVAAPPPIARRHAMRLAVLGGLVLAVLVIGVPLANHYLGRSTVDAIPVSGLDIVIVVTVILITVRIIEGRRAPTSLAATGLP